MTFCRIQVFFSSCMSIPHILYPGIYQCPCVLNLSHRLWCLLWESRAALGERGRTVCHWSTKHLTPRDSDTISTVTFSCWPCSYFISSSLRTTQVSALVLMSFKTDLGYNTHLLIPDPRVALKLIKMIIIFHLTIFCRHLLTHLLSWFITGSLNCMNDRYYPPPQKESCS